MSQRGRDIIVGLTGIAGVVGIAFLMMLFGYAPAWLKDGYDVTLTMPHASGLNEGSRVRMSGKDIGRIESVVLRGPPAWGVRVVAKIGEEYDVPADVRVGVEAPILGGSPALSLEPRRNEADADVGILVRDGSARLDITQEIPGLASRFSAELRSALKATVTDLRVELSRAQGNLDRLAGAWVTVADHLAELLEPRSPSLVDAEGETAANLSTVIARADERLMELQGVIEGVSVWVTDASLREQISSLAVNANRLSAKIAGGVDQVTEIADAAATSFEALVVALVAVSDELSQAIASARGVLAEVSQGKGTAALMLNDPAVYNSMQDAFERLGRALEEMRMLVEKWQREGLPVKF